MRTMCVTDVETPGSVFIAVAFATLLVVLVSSNLQAQGTVTFDQPWTTNGIGYFGRAQFNGMNVEVAPPFPHGELAHVGGGLTGHPNNGTPHIEFRDPGGLSQHVLFNLTNGAPFGLTSVDLADPVLPSLAPVNVTFNGFKLDGSMVSQTFTVGGGGSATFQTFLFNADFVASLTRVEIPSTAWAMDNVVWIPEPGAVSMLMVGLAAFIARRRGALD